LAETSAVKSRPSVPYGANLFGFIVLSWKTLKLVAAMRIVIMMIIIIIVSIQGYLAKGHITILLPLAAVNGFFWSWLPYNTHVDLHESAPFPQVASRLVELFLHSLSVWQTDRHADHATCVCVVIGCILCTMCRRFGLIIIIIRTIKYFFSAISITIQAGFIEYPLIWINNSFLRFGKLTVKNCRPNRYWP